MKNIAARMDAWLSAISNSDWKNDKHERGTRFLEEGIELFQTLGYTKAQVSEMMDSVYAKQAGSFREEVTGTFLTLLSLCVAHDIDLMEVVSEELTKYESRVAEYKVKHLTKVRFNHDEENETAVP